VFLSEFAKEDQLKAFLRVLLQPCNCFPNSAKESHLCIGKLNEELLCSSFFYEMQPIRGFVMQVILEKIANATKSVFSQSKKFSKFLELLSNFSNLKENISESRKLIKKMESSNNYQLDALEAGKSILPILQLAVAFPRRFFGEEDMKKLILTNLIIHLCFTETKKSQDTKLVIRTIIREYAEHFQSLFTDVVSSDVLYWIIRTGEEGNRSLIEKTLQIVAGWGRYYASRAISKSSEKSEARTKQLFDTLSESRDLSRDEVVLVVVKTIRDVLLDKESDSKQFARENKGKSVEIPTFNIPNSWFSIIEALEISVSQHLEGFVDQGMSTHLQELSKFVKPATYILDFHRVAVSEFSASSHAGPANSLKYIGFVLSIVTNILMSEENNMEQARSESVDYL